MKGWNLTRRGFLKASSAAPLVARSVAASAIPQIEAASGIGVLGRSVSGAIQPEEPDWERHDQQESSRVRKLLDWVVTRGLPNWKLRQIETRSRYNRMLDPDIASFRSVSVSHKLRMQWQRDQKRMVQQEMDRLNHHRERERWLKKVGIEYW